MRVQRNRRLFQPCPYPSAAELIVSAVNETLVAGDTTFVKKLDPEFVAKDLVNYEHVRIAMEKYPEWKNDPSVHANGSIANPGMSVS